MHPALIGPPQRKKEGVEDRLLKSKHVFRLLNPIYVDLNVLKCHGKATGFKLVVFTFYFQTCYTI